MKTLSFSVFSSSVFHGNLNFSLESLIGVEQPPDERAEAFGVGCLHVVDAASQQAQGEAQNHRRCEPRSKRPVRSLTSVKSMCNKGLVSFDVIFAIIIKLTQFF